jgi:hypothetical protein
MPCGGCLHGAAGLAKAVVGLGLADKATIESRRAICRECPEAIPCAKAIGRFCQCRKCGCLLKAKTKLSSEACPLGHWKTSGLATANATPSNDGKAAEA